MILKINGTPVEVLDDVKDVILTPINVDISYGSLHLLHGDLNPISSLHDLTVNVTAFIQNLF